MSSRSPSAPLYEQLRSFLPYLVVRMPVRVRKASKCCGTTLQTGLTFKSVGLRGHYVKNWIFYLHVIFRAAPSTRKRFCLFFFGEVSEEKARRKMVSHGGQPCKCILKFWGSREALLCVIFSSNKDSAARPCSLNKTTILILAAKVIEPLCSCSWNVAATQGGLAPLQLTQSDSNKMQQIHLFITEITRFFPRCYKEGIYEQGAVFLVSLYLRKS